MGSRLGNPVLHGLALGSGALGYPALGFGQCRSRGDGAIVFLYFCQGLFGGDVAGEVVAAITALGGKAIGNTGNVGDITIDRKSVV